MCELRFEPKIVFFEGQENQKALLATLKAFTREEIPERKKVGQLIFTANFRHFVFKP